MRARGFRRWMVLLSIGLCLWLPAASEAIVVVEDLLNEFNTTQALIKHAVEIENQMRMLENQVKGLAYDALNVSKSPLQLLGQIQALWQAYNSVLDQAQGLAFHLAQTQANFQRTYPAFAPGNVQGMVTATQTMLGSLREATTTATKAQSIADRLQQEAQRNQEGLTAAYQAAGALQIAQVQAQMQGNTNELLANLAEVEAATGRVQTEWIAMQNKEDADAQALNARFMSDYGTSGYKAIGQSTGVPLR